jgi:hypothetical protein
MGSGGSRSLWPPGKTGFESSFYFLALHSDNVHGVCVITQTVWVLYGQASRAISMG